MKCNVNGCTCKTSKVLETRQSVAGLRRVRICARGNRFTTVERYETWDRSYKTWVEAPPEPARPHPAVSRADVPRRWQPAEVPAGVTTEAAPLLLAWWNESRLLKHKSKAVWSQRAWLASAERVAALPPGQQVELCRAGIEQGWQALKPEYLKTAPGPRRLETAAGRPMPRDPAMLAALDQWTD